MTIERMKEYLRNYGFEVYVLETSDNVYTFRIDRHGITRYGRYIPGMADISPGYFLRTLIEDFEEDERHYKYCKYDVVNTMNLKKCVDKLFDLRSSRTIPEIENVIFNEPATIVFWADGTKTVVKCQEDDIFDPEKGLAMAISKKALGNEGNYCNVIKKWTEKYESKELKYEHSGFGIPVSVLSDIMSELEKRLTTRTTDGGVV